MASAGRALGRASTHQATGLGARAKRLTAAALQVAAVFLLVELALYNVDPLGITRYRYGQSLLLDARYPTAAGYALADGMYNAGAWSFTARDGLRVVPDTNANAQRTLVFVGDSVTFGFGVNDSDTFVNLLAREMRGWRIVNAAQSAYNIDNIEDTLALYPDADCRVYIGTANDNEPRERGATVPYSYMPATLSYLQWYQARASYPTIDYSAWIPRAQAIRDGGVLVTIFGRTRQSAEVQAAGAPFVELPYYSDFVSYSDTHPQRARASADSRRATASGAGVV